jgi:hypothetical protein
VPDTPSSGHWRAQALDLLGSALAILSALAPIAVGVASRLAVRAPEQEGTPSHQARPEELVAMSLGVLSDLKAQPSAEQSLGKEGLAQIERVMKTLAQVPTSSGQAVAATEIEVEIRPTPDADDLAQVSPIEWVGVSHLLLRDAQALYEGNATGWCNEATPAAPFHLIGIGPKTWRVCDHNPSHGPYPYP